MFLSVSWSLKGRKKKTVKSERIMRRHHAERELRKYSTVHLLWPHLLFLWLLDYVLCHLPPLSTPLGMTIPWPCSPCGVQGTICFVTAALCGRCVRRWRAEGSAEHVHPGWTTAQHSHIWLNAWLIINNPIHNEIKMTWASATVLRARWLISYCCDQA